MSSDVNQNQVERLFAQAVNLADVEQQAFLRNACGDDARLLAAVQRLLAAEFPLGETATFRQPPPDDDPRPGGRDSHIRDPLIDARIGPYQVKRRLGEGGFGNVYLAFRSDNYRQKVAVKVLRSDIDVSERVLARFELERQLLADLQHEHIARLLYGGTLDNGRPYIVMEFVRGEPITQYCDSKRLAISSRLALFRQACEAVSYAHGYSVIHRDLKPDNILVSEEGQVKLLDFGIAKMIDPISKRRMLTISEGGMPMTPQYGSPEQVRGKGLSTASDVYSLGVILYELLTGRRPYEFAHFTAAEVERVICDVEPRKPSTVVLQPLRVRHDDGTEDIRSADTLAEPRGADPHKLQRQLKGDLEQIVLMALRKDPERRYKTVDALVQDLQRFEAGQTVVARPVSRFERTRRWCRRNPIVAALSALVIFLIAGASIIAPLVAVQQAVLRRETEAASREAKFNQVDGLWQPIHQSYKLRSRGTRATMTASVYEATAVLAELAESENDVVRLTERRAETSQGDFEAIQKLYNEDKLSLELLSQSMATKARVAIAEGAGDRRAHIESLAQERDARLALWRRIAALHESERRGGEREKYHLLAAQFAECHAKLLMAVDKDVKAYQSILALPQGLLPPAFDGSTSSKALRSALNQLETLVEPDFQILQGDRVARTGDWNRAVKFFLRAKEINPEDPDAYSYLAAAHLAAGNTKAHQVVCQEMIKKAYSDDERVVLTCVVVPNAVEDPSLLVSAAENLQRNLGDSEQLVAAALFRTGQFPEALAQFRPWKMPWLRARDYAFLAMVHQRLGNNSDAMQALNEARQKLDGVEDWRDKTETDYLIREAESIVSAPPRN